MPNATIPQRAVIGLRPSHTPEGAPIPAEWPIYNTTRPTIDRMKRLLDSMTVTVDISHELITLHYYPKV